MKESIANSMIFYIIIIFVGVLIGLLVTSISYSKAFKIKNRIIEMIENHTTYDQELEAEIDEMLGTLGYRINRFGINNSCPKENGQLAINQSSKYRYCVYKYNTELGTYYRVTAYMYFDIPLTSGISIPVYGETKTFFDL